MRDVLGPNTTLGYCSNVHAGSDLAQTLANLDTHAVAVKRLVSPDAPMGVGLWLSAQTAEQIMRDPDGIAKLRDWLGERGLLVYTLNGFPYGDFHGDVVKHAVYQPDWSDPKRLYYTLQLSRILAGLLPDIGCEGSISTLPVGWGATMANDPERFRAAVAQLRNLVHHLARVELDTGRFIHVALEPEPGCHLDRADDVVTFFKQHLLPGPDERSTRAYLRVCHDVCHSAVMFEPQQQAIAAYRAAGIAIGKVQLSAAVTAAGENAGALAAFNEPRYLHQTAVRADGGVTLHDDLPDALATAPRRGEWRTHFHVPVFAAELDGCRTTQDELVACLKLLRGSDVTHYEVETYAWNVLPESLRPADLDRGIAKELQWVSEQASRLGLNSRA
jgi:hypothetical protein